MNARVRELAAQAVDYSLFNVYRDSEFFTPIAMERFAELLLAEVGQHLTNKGLDHAREVIEKEFGI